MGELDAHRAEVAGGGEMTHAERFFVKIAVGRRRDIRKLASLSLDLHAQSGSDERPTVDGLLTLDEVARVVRAGFPVTVEADAESRAYGRTVIEFTEWLAAQEADLGTLGEV